MYFSPQDGLTLIDSIETGVTDELVSTIGIFDL